MVGATTCLAQMLKTKKADIMTLWPEMPKPVAPKPLMTDEGEHIIHDLDVNREKLA